MSAFWARLEDCWRGRCWTMTHYAMVEKVCVGEPEPAVGGGFWIRPLWRIDRFYVLGIRMPTRLALAMGIDEHFHF